MPMRAEIPSFERTPEEKAEWIAQNPGFDPTFQIVPFKVNPNAYAKYRVLQNGVEVGFVYVKGQDEFHCTETWQLYNVNVPAGLAPYIWASPTNGQTASVNTSLQLAYVGPAAAVTPPANLSAGQYTTLTSSVLPG
jgi:hypothetical protein